MSAPEKIAERKFAGSYTPSIDDEEIILGQGHRESSEQSHAMSDNSYGMVATATVISTGREPSGSRISDSSRRPHPEQFGAQNMARPQSEYYQRHSFDHSPWAEQGDYHHQSSGSDSRLHGSVSSASRESRHSIQGPMTGLHGPSGTSGKEPRMMDTQQYSKLLNEGYSRGLAHALTENASRYDFRFWVVDNSGSMQIGDGHRIVSKDGKWKAVACTRWEEIKETVKYHAQMASVLDCPTIFQLLNDPGMRTAPQKFSVGEHGAAYAHSEVATVIDILRKVSPSGVTPLTQHIWNIERHISDMASELRRSGKIVAIILATDGLPTDELGYGGEEITEEFIRALRSLEGLPVWTVIRLCTDEDAVKRFYNSLDSQLEISVEVLDDYMGEAREVHKFNPWITYALPLHRCRELGYHDRLFDLIDERPLTAGEARSFCCFIFGVKEDGLPDPGEDPSAFLKCVKAMLDNEQLQWNPIKKKMTPWILVKDLKKSFSNKNCVVM